MNQSAATSNNCSPTPRPSDSAINSDAIWRLTPAAMAHHLTRGRWTWADHLELMSRKAVETVAASDRLIVTVPPRFGKSELISIWLPVWFLATWPHRRVALACYGHELASTFGRQVRNILQEHGPRLGVALAEDAQAVDNFATTAGGGMLSVGVGGPLTGRGADLLIIDDPIKNHEAANSQTQRDDLWEWYQSTARTRLEPGGSIIVCSTRWHTDDLVGRLLSQMNQNGEAWQQVRMPALAEEDDVLERELGESLWPERFDLDDLLERQKGVGSRVWQAMYQQDPLPASGALFRAEWLRSWRPVGDGYQLLSPEKPKLIPREQVRRFVAVDLAISSKSTADYTVVLLAGVTPENDLLVLDVIREQLDGPAQLQLLRRCDQRWRPTYLAIEATSYQIAAVQELKRDGLTVKALKADRDKVSRALTAAARMEVGSIYFPESAPWRLAFEQELLAFPDGRHDDQVDCLGYAALEVASRFQSALVGPVGIPRRSPWDFDGELRRMPRPW